jgi:hypothetical protein
MVPSPAKERNVTVFLSDLKVSEEQSIPVAIETNRRHFRGTVTTISEEGGYVVIEVPAGFGSREASTILMADIVSVRINA